MRREDIEDAVGMVDPLLVARAGVPVVRRRHTRLITAVAAVLLVAIGVGVFWGNGLFGFDAYALATARYPQMNAYPGEEASDEQWQAWNEDRRTQGAYFGNGVGLSPFFGDTVAALLGEAEGNAVCSPLNIYMALAMLAEITEGESRAQLLAALGAADIAALRTQANAIWNAAYCDDGLETCRLAASLWLSDEYTYEQSVLLRLADTYYASSYRGEMGAASYNRALRQWLNRETEGLLTQMTEEATLTPDTVIALVTTLYFSAKWSDEFERDDTRPAPFYTPHGSKQCDFMHKSEVGQYAWGEHFSAVSKHLEHSGTMWFLLPDEGVSVSDLIRDPEALAFITGNSSWDRKKTLSVNLSLPRFDVSARYDLGSALRSLGIEAPFSQSADFSPLGTGLPLSLTSAEHGARLVVDERGVKAAAYTMVLCGTGMPPSEEIDFVLDRPFLFVLTSRDGLPLFVGVVSDPS